MRRVEGSESIDRREALRRVGQERVEVLFGPRPSVKIVARGRQMAGDGERADLIGEAKSFVDRSGKACVNVLGRFAHAAAIQPIDDEA